MACICAILTKVFPIIVTYEDGGVCLHYEAFFNEFVDKFTVTVLGCVTNALVLTILRYLLLPIL